MPRAVLHSHNMRPVEPGKARRDDLRVTIARALINHHGLVPADEPTDNLGTAPGASIVDFLAFLVGGRSSHRMYGFEGVPERAIGITCAIPRGWITI